MIRGRVAKLGVSLAIDQSKEKKRKVHTLLSLSPVFASSSLFHSKPRKKKNTVDEQRGKIKRRKSEKVETIV